MDNLAAITEEGLFDFLFEFSGNTAESKMDSGTLKYVISEIPKFCNVFGTVFDDDKLVSEVERIIDLYTGIGTPFFWITGPGTKPVNTPHLLREKGLVDSGSIYGCIMKLSDTGNLEVHDNNFIIKEVADSDELNIWIDIVSIMFHFSGNQPQILAEILEKKVFLENKFRLFLGLVDNETICTGALHLGRSSAGCFWISTQNHMRRKGYATKMMRQIMETARGSGFSYLSLQSNREAYGIYKKLGFSHCCDFQFYSHS
jgi:ribosomal protein S18 acetylase RimI-like enzyme